jgi:hypothetical protein
MFDGEYEEEVRKQAVMSVSERNAYETDTVLEHMRALSVVVMVVPVAATGHCGLRCARMST